MRQKLTLGHSPDPDDAFMFFALAKGLVDDKGYDFEHILQDIQTLNERAQREELDISAVSLHAFAYISDKYALLPCGASIGDNYGPMVVGRRRLSVAEMKTTRLAVPGTMTTAFLALRLAIGDFEYEVAPFDQIIPEVVSGRFEAGLIIHEGQLTYGAAGLTKSIDLGEWWKTETGLPLPLGGNVVRRSLGEKVIVDVREVMYDTIRYGLEHRREAVKHSLQYARDMGFDLADKFVGMYVNDYTLDYGDDGRQAVELMLSMGAEQGIVPAQPRIVFA